MNLFGTYFTLHQFVLLSIALLFFLISILFYVLKDKKTISVAFLLLGAFTLGGFAITLDSYLNMWDEQFHALVAKNLAHNFLKPVLYPQAILPYDKNSWTENYIWLHKPPFFLWQMAISIKLFGSSVFAIRFPSVLCFTFATFCTYKIGKNMLKPAIGYLGALLFGSNYFFVELLSGSTPTDHNDIVFISYVTASIWALSEHILNPDKRKWIYLIGIFAGAAILTKWLAGSLVYAGWLVYIMTGKKKSFLAFSNYKNLLISLVITTAIVLPWELYIFSVFPKEAAFEYALNKKHFTEALEGHSGHSWFYYDALNKTLGYLFSTLCFAGLLISNRYFEKRNVFFAFLSLIIIVFAFFTLAATKMEGFVLIVSSLLFLSIGCLMYYFYQLANTRTVKIISFVIISSVSLFLNLNPEKLQIKHTVWKQDFNDYYDRIRRTEWKEFCEMLKTNFKGNKYAVFNCPEVYENISLMYYTNFLGYKKLPDKEDISLLEQNGYKAIIIDNGMLDEKELRGLGVEIISTPRYKTIRTDTVYIKNRNSGFLSLFGNQLISNDSSNREVFTIRRFSDGFCYIKNSKGNLATLDYYNWPGQIIFGRKEYTVTERFKLDSLGNNLYRIKTQDNEVLKVIDKGRAICADNRPELTDDAFEIIKK